MTTTPSKFKKSCPSAPGLSLVELMVVVMVLGILASIALNSFGGARQGAEDQKDRRNAQEIASVAGMASAAGASFIVPGDAQASILNLRDGVSPDKGPFRGRLFKIGIMEDSEITGAMRFLVMAGEELQYNTTGS